EHRERHGDRKLRRLFSGGEPLEGGSEVLPIQPRRRGGGIRQPVQRDVVDNPFGCQATRDIAVEKRSRDLLVAVFIVEAKRVGDANDEIAHRAGCHQRVVALRAAKTRESTATRCATSASRDHMGSYANTRSGHRPNNSASASRRSLPTKRIDTPPIVRKVG